MPPFPLTIQRLDLVLDYILTTRGERECREILTALRKVAATQCHTSFFLILYNERTGHLFRPFVEETYPHLIGTVICPDLCPACVQGCYYYCLSRSKKMDEVEP